MKNKLRNYFIVSVVLIFSGISGFLSCNSDTGADRTASVLIDTGIRNGNKNAKDAAPPNVTAIGLSVSAGDMNTINATIPISTGSLSVEVPVGTRRTFTVTASTESFSFIGSATADVLIDSVNDITIIPVKQAATLNITIPNKINYTGTVQSFNLTVDYPGTSISITDTITPSASDTTSLEVPTGSGANITLTTTPLSQSAVVTFSTETATSDFTLGNTASVTLSPRVSETKIVIPDYSNNRIVQIDSIPTAGTTWDDLLQGQINYLGTFRPADIDFDRQGNIFIANDTPESAGAYLIIRISNIKATSYTEITLGNMYGMYSIAMDRINNDLYYTTNSALNTLHRIDLDTQCSSYPCADTTLTSANMTNMRGLAVDDNGILYVACSITGSGNVIAKYNPTTQSVIDTYPIASGTPWDVLYKSPYIYAANYNPAGGGSVIELNTADLSFSSELTQDPGTSTAFNGPHRFLAILNNRFYLIDEDEGTPGDTERITAFDNFSGNWEFFDPSMVGQSAFQFFSLC